MRGLWQVLPLIVALSTPLPAQADDVTGQIDEALAAYRKKDLATALAALDAAAGLIRQMKVEAWKSALPDPLPGWTAEEAEGTALSPALLGGATTVSRKYEKSGSTVTVSVIADSPVVQGIAAFLSSGIGGLIGDAKIVVLDGRRLLYTKGDNSYQTMVGNRVLVKVEGGQNVDDQTLRQYLKAVKFGEFEKMAQ